MAYPSPVIWFIASLLIAMTSVGHRIFPNHNLPDVTSNNDRQPEVLIPGVLRCFVPPVNCPGFPNLVAGVSVALTCGGGKTVIAEAVTNTSGFFQIVVDSSRSILFDASNTNACRVTAKLPIASCAVFLHTGVLENPLGPVQTITDELFGNADGQETRPCTVSSDNGQSKAHDDHVLSTGRSSHDQSTLHDEHHITYTGNKSSYHNDQYSTMQENVHT
ncbi:hypothetical protein PanWU01x14_002150 [Parasponia andersonii]|uniref:Pollen Ole e 1 allergen and extensin family protein n=1 Tax=Parasponia andersonii TaxID=3476 RepID=A0A2P5E559_PARAD|nr:hypothetical protein PanWU01x14_002150 [Parasponia andersonii]